LALHDKNHRSRHIVIFLKDPKVPVCSSDDPKWADASVEYSLYFDWFSLKTDLFCKCQLMRVSCNNIS